MNRPSFRYRLACWLGLHRWAVAPSSEWVQVPGTRDFIAPHACLRCPKRAIRKV